MRALIVTGGTISDEFAEKRMDEMQFDLTIAADSGMEFFYRNGKTPQYIVGDFDSVKQDIFEYFKKNEEITFRQFRPEKDETDTELALTMSVDLGADEIYLLGATGSRIDHVLGNIHLLCKPMARGAKCYILDPNNRIQVLNSKTTLKRAEQFGKYVSLLPLTTEATGITLKGFKYPLNDYTMTSDNSLGVSNEIVDEEAVVDVKTGILIMIESKD